VQQMFTLHAMVFCTINDYPACSNLSGYSMKGHHACPVCEKNTCFLQLKHGKKTVYTRHRRFLKQYHPYRRLKKAFNGLQENESAPKALDGKEVYDCVKDIVTIFGNTQKNLQLRQTYGRKGPYSLIFHSGPIFMLDIV